MSLYPDLEIKILNEGRYNRIIGIDEVGRGCWAGPVHVGAYIFTKDLEIIEGVKDSKLLNLKQRLSLCEKLKLHTHRIFSLKSSEIDEIGVGKSVERLISQAINCFSDEKTLFLIDGRFKSDFGENSRKIIDGDYLHYSIAAASILAKVARDNEMNELDLKYINYGFKNNKGYGTKAHREIIKKLGICEIHRRSFKPISFYAS